MKRLDRSARVRPARPHKAATRPVAQLRELSAGEIGARGDALAAGEGGPIYLPYALPGERVRAQVAGDRGTVLEVLTPSLERVAPPCRHFGACGGCQLQHWAQAPYLAWKRAQVVQALARRGLETPVEPIIPAWGEGRRRAAFHAVRQGRGVAFGFIQRGGGAIVPVEACPVLAPGLARALPALRELARAFPPQRGEITLPTLLTDEGLDVEIKGLGRPSGFDRAALERAAEVAAALDFARLSFEGEPAVARRTPTLRMGLARVAPPPGAFLQPTAAGEETLARLAIEALAGATRVADLFCGVGTFALRFAAFAETHAVEGDTAMLAALKRAADAAGGALKAVTVEQRDLLRAPLSALEMKRFDAVAFDPPRSGARLQAEQIAKSKATRVAAISCDPATFARDARALVDGGFRLVRVTPVDQFLWSPHVEIVGAFAR